MQQGSCQNPFEGCTPYVNCPYYYNPAGKCDSSPDIYPGVFTVFWDAESCCRTNFPSDVSKCEAAAVVVTPEPTLAPTSLAPVAAPKEFQLVSIPPIPITLINSTGPVQFDEDQRMVLEAIIINSTANEIGSEVNATIQSMNLTRTNQESGDTESSFELHPIVIVTTDTTYTPEEIRGSILKILKNQNSDINSQLNNLLGIILSFSSMQNDDGIKDNNNLLVDDSNNVLAAVLASVLSVLFVLVCVGLIIRGKRKKKKLSTTKNDAAVDTNNQNVAIDDSSAVASIADESRPSFKAQETDDGYDGGNSTYNMNSAFDESDFSLPTVDSSKEEGDSVLGLLYYDGPDSSDSEDNAHQSRAASRASRRSRRSNRSKKSTRTSAVSRKSRASAAQKSRRSSRQIPLEKLDEGTEYRQSKRRDPDGFDGSTIMSGSQSCKGSTFVYRGRSMGSTNAPSIAGDSLSFGTYPPQPVESVASNAKAPSITTLNAKLQDSITRDPPGYDSYSRRNSKGGSRREMSDTIDASSVSVNSSGEHTGDLHNQPEVKF